MCRDCGYRREIDQAPDKNNTVEAKSTSDAVTGSKQKKNNLARLGKGKCVRYKTPPLGAQKVQALLNDGFRHIPIG